MWWILMLWHYITHIITYSYADVEWMKTLQGCPQQICRNHGVSPLSDDAFVLITIAFSRVVGRERSIFG